MYKLCHNVTQIQNHQNGRTLTIDTWAGNTGRLSATMSRSETEEGWMFIENQTHHLQKKMRCHIQAPSMAMTRS